MITVCLKNFILEDRIRIINEQDQIRIKATGHSGSGIRGTDIVCSAVSAVIQTSVIAITKVAGLHQNIDQKEGYIESVIFHRNAGIRNISDLTVILHTMIIGLEEIMRSFPGSVEIIFE